MLVSPNQSNILTALRSYLLAVLPPGVDVLRSQVNRVAESVDADFVMMTPLRQERLETNVDSYADCLFNASIAGSVLTVNSVSIGTVSVGAQLFGLGLSGTLTITGFLSGTGATGTYAINGSLTLPSQTLAAGLKALLQPTEWVIQCDAHGPNSADIAEIISTTFRDEYAVSQFSSSGFDITPLFADDPKQVVFINDQEQMEDRWVIEIHLQANQIISVSQQFADFVTLNLVEVP
jgi:hypothetical protein